MNRDLFYTAYNAYLNGMIKQAWGGNFAAQRAQNAYARGNTNMGNRLMNRAYRRGYPMGGYGQQQQPMQQQPMQQPQKPMQQQPMLQPAPQGLPPTRPQQPMQQQQPQQNQWKPAPYQDAEHLMMSTGERDMYGRPLQMADLRG